ncbi:MAG: hypothetical protein ABIH66_04555 [bacterium]
MAKKKATSKKTAAAKTGGADITFEKAVPEFLAALKEQGKNERTVEVYGRCIENAVNFFGADRPLGKLTPMLIGQYFKSDAFLKKPNGKAKSDITTTQGRRVLRLMLVWANERGYLADIPLPKSEMKGDKKKDGNGTGDNEPADSAQGN